MVSADVAGHIKEDELWGTFVGTRHLLAFGELFSPRMTGLLALLDLVSLVPEVVFQYSSDIWNVWDQ